MNLLNTSPDLQKRAHGIKLLILDVDGVLTDGSLYYSATGEELKAFNIQDGLGLRMLQAGGVEIAIITGRTSHAVRSRSDDLGIHHVHQGVQDKRAAFERLLADLGLSESAAAAMGDDLPDLPVLRRCGLAFSVPDAPALVRAHAHYVSRKRGGCGAVREVSELLLRARGAWPDCAAQYLSQT